MDIRIVPYAAEHEEEVRRFLSRIRAAGLDPRRYSLHFPESCIPAWQAVEAGDLHEEYFLALDADSVVRGGYILKHQSFLLRGELRRLAHYSLPLSEGIADRRFAPVALNLLEDALARQPLLMSLGIGGPEIPMGRFLRAAGWSFATIPFFFRVVHPRAFLRNIEVLRTSAVRRMALDALAATGLGWLAVKALQAMRRAYVPPAAVSWAPVTEPDDWADVADQVWCACRGRYGLVAARDRRILGALYPLAEQRFIRLTVRRSGRPIGWAVLLATSMSSHKQFGGMRVGTLVDCLALPEDARDVAACARQCLAAAGVDLMVSNQASDAWGQALRDCGFLRGPSNFLLAAAPKLAAQLEPFAASAGTFHLNRGDGDGPINL